MFIEYGNLIVYIEKNKLPELIVPHVENEVCKLRLKKERRKKIKIGMLKGPFESYFVLNVLIVLNKNKYCFKLQQIQRVAKTTSTNLRIIFNQIREKEMARYLQ